MPNILKSNTPKFIFVCLGKHARVKEKEREHERRKRHREEQDKARREWERQKRRELAREHSRRERYTCPSSPGQTDRRGQRPPLNLSLIFHCSEMTYEFRAKSCAATAMFLGTCCLMKVCSGLLITFLSGFTATDTSR